VNLRRFRKIFFAVDVLILFLLVVDGVLVEFIALAMLVTRRCSARTTSID
jgi:hypothetical protein